MIGRPIQKNLRLIFQSPERARVNNPRPIALEFRPVKMPRLREFAPARVARFLRERRERASLIRLYLLAPFPTLRGHFRPGT